MANLKSTPCFQIWSCIMYNFGFIYKCKKWLQIGFLTSDQETQFRNLEMEILWSRNENENFYLTLLLRKEAHVSVLIVVKKVGQGYLFYDRLSWYYHSLWVLTFSASAFISNFFWETMILQRVDANFFPTFLALSLNHIPYYVSF